MGNLSELSFVQRNTIPLRDIEYSIINCESGFDYKAQNKNSSAHGLGQFIDGTKKYVEEKWKIDLNWDNYDDQLYAFLRLHSEEGNTHWLASKHCWGAR